MKRKLFKQIRREWRTNIWMGVELLIVSVVLWYCADYFYTTFATLSMPRGFDTEHCYQLKIDNVAPNAPGFDPDRQNNDAITEDALEIVERLRRLPFIEAVSISQNSFPYNGSNSGTYIWHDSIHSEGYLVRRCVTPDFVKVFRYQGLRGETPDQLAEMLERGEILVGGHVFADGVEPKDVVGLDFTMSDDTTRTFRVGAALLPVRYHDYTYNWTSTVVRKIPDSWIAWAGEYCVRVRAADDRDIVTRLMDQAETQFHVGNLVLVDVRSFKTIRDNYQQIHYNATRDMVLMIIFVLINVFLGLFGTFWFRTQQRAQEIAIRKSMGATNGSIFRRLVSEGIVILTLVTPLALGLDWLLTYAEINSYFYVFFSWGRYLACAAIAYGLIALMIVAGVWFPASRASRLDPALVLKDE